MRESMPPAPTSRDPYELMLVRLTVVGQARVLVSGDKELLCLAKAFKPMTGYAIV